MNEFQVLTTKVLEIISIVKFTDSLDEKLGFHPSHILFIIKLNLGISPIHPFLSTPATISLDKFSSSITPQQFSNPYHCH